MCHKKLCIFVHECVVHKLRVCSVAMVEITLKMELNQKKELSNQQLPKVVIWAFCRNWGKKMQNSLTNDF